MEVNLQYKKEEEKNKRKMLKNMFLDTYGVAAPEDVCDAICLGEHHSHKINSELNFE